MSSKETSQWDGSIEYQQHMLWLRNKKINFQKPTLIVISIFLQMPIHLRSGIDVHGS